MAVVVAGVCVAVDEVVAAEQSPGQVGMGELDAGVEDGDGVRCAGRERPGVAHAHAVERVLAGGLRVIDPNRGHRSFIGQLDPVVRLSVRDRWVSHELGDDLLDRPALGRQQARDPLARCAQLRHDAEPSSAAGRRIHAFAEADDDLTGDHLTAGRGRRRCAVRVGLDALRLGSADRDGGGGQEEQCEEEDGGGSGHVTGTPVRCGEVGAVALTPVNPPNRTSPHCVERPDHGPERRLGPMDYVVSSSRSRALAAATARPRWLTRSFSPSGSSAVVSPLGSRKIGS